MCSIYYLKYGHIGSYVHAFYRVLVFLSCFGHTYIILLQRIYKKILLQDKKYYYWKKPRLCFCYFLIKKVYVNYSNEQYILF